MADGRALPYAQPTWVFTHRACPPCPGPNAVRAGRRAPGPRGDAGGRRGKNLWVVGGGDLAGQFLDAGLLDELIVQVGSVTLGRGKPLFPRRLGSATLRLVSVRGRHWIRRVALHGVAGPSFGGRLI